METGTLSCPCGWTFKGTRDEAWEATKSHAQQVHSDMNMSEEDMRAQFEKSFVPDEG